MNYVHIDREALAVTAEVRKFHVCIYGCKFTVVTDHNQLLGLFTKTGPAPQIISPCMLCWSLLFNAYNRKCHYQSGKLTANADALSRLPLSCPEFTVSFTEVLMPESSSETPLQADDITHVTAKDPLLPQVLNLV